ncbi:glycosyltransferase family 2 protein [Methylobacterium sp. 17Sr1-1]|uniref:glycosyltransferase family 2 protein n=1 Tax=Methylobacterium sp. 17Sr1-1 TaxID=2202826 RepID=UPI000D6FBAF7|nr:glycosyltransferase family 2 protein [Methylobacterium sp. 17Sr1-1]AWN52728.1 hypothetical protein DK412_14755 [Methylobacterium sp. 17Sr1-1]
MVGSYDTVSVIIPTYNRLGLLIRAVDSVLAQTYPPMEILICDDGSADGTDKFVLEHTDPRVKWVEAEFHSGWPGVPRNRGIRQAKGEWLAFMDDDDTWHPTKLSRQMTSLKDGKYLASSTEAWRFISGKPDPVLLVNSNSEYFDLKALACCNFVVCSSAVVSKKIIDKVGFFPEDKLCEDYALWLGVCCFTSFVYINDPLVSYRDAPEVSVRQKSKPEAQQQLAVFEQFKAWLLSERPPNVDDALSIANDRIDWWRGQIE